MAAAAALLAAPEESAPESHLGSARRARIALSSWGPPGEERKRLVLVEMGIQS